MTDLFPNQNQVRRVKSFQELVSLPFQGEVNAMCWERQLAGDFSEIVRQVELKEDLVTLNATQLRSLSLSAQGELAREVLLKDLECLQAHGASPTLNVIRCYERDDDNPFFPTDVYSFHVDRSPVPTDTFLCTYYGAPSEILPNAQGLRKVEIPAIREQIRQQYQGRAEDFDTFLAEHFLDLHYEAIPGAQPLSLGHGHLWRLAIDHPESQVPPCLHRAPRENPGESRLLLIC